MPLSLVDDRARARQLGGSAGFFFLACGDTGISTGASPAPNSSSTCHRRFYSVDTFVSSDTPLESPHFAHAPLGSDPVLAAIENSSASPDHEPERVRAIAASAGIPLQIGLTQGGNRWDAVHLLGRPQPGILLARTLQPLPGGGAGPARPLVAFA